MKNGKFVYTCRKCQTERKLIIRPGYTAANIMRMLKDITESDCPTCGEEPYMNWMITGVVLPVEKEE